MIPIVSIVGRSGVGKTTLLERLLPELKRRGYRLATIKHGTHDFEIDQPGKDSHRLFQAGSDWTVIASPHKLASIRRLTVEPSLADLAADIHGVDLILTEGFKRQARLRVEISRRACGTDLISPEADLLAVVADHPAATSAPVFHLDDTAALADLIEQRVLGRPAPDPPPPAPPGGPI